MKRFLLLPALALASPSPASYFKDAIEEEFTPRRIK